MTPSPYGRAMHEPGEVLILLNITAAHGAVILQSIWATTGDLLAGHRLTRVELVADQAGLSRRLDALIPRLCRPPA